MKRSKYILIRSVFIILIFTSISCHQQNDSASHDTFGLFTKSIKVDGSLRRYAIYVPQDIGTSLIPLVLELNGGQVYIEDMTGESGKKSPYKLWMDLAETNNFIVVYPEGLPGTSGKPTWNDCRANFIVNSNADDVSFISSLIDEISLNYNIDPNRIYVSGPSNGGFMALRLAVELSDKIAAVSATIAAMPDSSECGQAQNPVSVLFMNGTNDNYVPYNGGTIGNPPDPDHGSVYSTEESVNIWTAFNQTDATPNIYNFPDLDTDDGGKVTRYTYSNGIEGTEVVLYQVNGGGHSAPSIQEQFSDLFELIFNKQNHDIEMTTEVWNFFKNKTLN